MHFKSLHFHFISFHFKVGALWVGGAGLTNCHLLGSVNFVLVTNRVHRVRTSLLYWIQR